MAPPQVITEKDANYGLYSLIERGLIPATANLTFEPFPITTHKPSSPAYYELKEKNRPKKDGNLAFTYQDSLIRYLFYDFLKMKFRINLQIGPELQKYHTEIPR